MGQDRSTDRKNKTSVCRKDATSEGYGAFSLRVMLSAAKYNLPRSIHAANPMRKKPGDVGTTFGFVLYDLFIYIRSIAKRDRDQDCQ